MGTDPVCDSMMTCPELVIFTVGSIAALEASAGSAYAGHPLRQRTGQELANELPG